MELDPATLEPMWYASSEPHPNRLLVFSLAPTLRVEALPPFTPNSEASERGVIYGPEGIDKSDTGLVFPLHVEAARRYFAARSIRGPDGLHAALSGRRAARGVSGCRRTRRRCRAGRGAGSG